MTAWNEAALPGKECGPEMTLSPAEATESSLSEVFSTD